MFFACSYPNILSTMIMTDDGCNMAKSIHLGRIWNLTLFFSFFLFSYLGIRFHVPVANWECKEREREREREREKKKEKRKKEKGTPISPYQLFYWPCVLSVNPLVSALTRTELAKYSSFSHWSWHSEWFNGKQDQFNPLQLKHQHQLEHQG